MSRFTLLLGGDLVVTPRLIAQVVNTRIIAADSGLRHARDLTLNPELWVGDFDSATALLERAYPDLPRERFPAEKDKTDGELAAAIALREGATSLVLAGAFGGLRTDHAFLHMALAVRLAEEGIPVILTSGSQEGLPLPHGRRSFDFADGTLFSIVGLSELAGLTVAGAKWPLANIDVPLGSSLTISNEVRGRLEVELQGGRAILIAHPFPIEGF
ncbi:MAG: thiamine diphosphokinase [Hyphomicrobiales bacterium]|jgi:thiamine pyrophosphokinase|nr:thiamine diphosphokinase [Hyphomicrobiales bacterium]MCO5080793.1 thiamine diphosphokinase [Rhizobiaceae bacterium]